MSNVVLMSVHQVVFDLKTWNLVKGAYVISNLSINRASDQTDPFVVE